MADRYAVWLDRDVVGATRARVGHLPAGPTQPGRPGPRRPAPAAWSWLLAPTGKVDALVRVTRLSTDDWLLDTDEGWGEAVLDPAQPVQAADQGRAGPSPLEGPGPPGSRRRPVGRPSGPGPAGRRGGLAGCGRCRPAGPGPGGPRRHASDAPRRLRSGPHRGRRAQDGRGADGQDHPWRDRSHRRRRSASPKAATPDRSWSPVSTLAAATCPATCAPFSCRTRSKPGPTSSTLTARWPER